MLFLVCIDRKIPLDIIMIMIMIIIIIIIIIIIVIIIIIIIIIYGNTEGAAISELECNV